MSTNEWRLASGERARAIEVRNALKGYDEIERLLGRVVSFAGRLENGATKMAPSSSEMLDLHRVLVLDLEPRAGVIRPGHVHVVDASRSVVFDPPQREELPDFLNYFNEQLRNMWRQSRSTEHIICLCAFCLWMVNFIHPFENGNGRTARYFCYLVACYFAGRMLPGRPTLPDIITTMRRQYLRGLHVASTTFLSTGAADLNLLEDLIRDAMNMQIISGLDYGRASPDDSYDRVGSSI